MPRTALAWQVGLVASLGGAPGTGGWPAAGAVALARAAEAAGFSRLLLDASAAPPGGAPEVARPDPFVLLGAAAATTSGLELGACTASGERPAPVLAKAAATLDVCAGGRALLGLAPAPGGTDLDLLQEELEVCRAMLRVPAPSFSGSHLRLERAWNEPLARRPVPLPLGLLVPDPLGGGDPAGEGQAEVAAAGLGLAARLCELALVDLRGRVTDQRAPELLGELGEAFARAARDGGRVPGSASLQALIGPEEVAGEEEVSLLARSCRAAGLGGVLLSWAYQAPGAGTCPSLDPARLARWQELLRAVASTG